MSNAINPEHYNRLNPQPKDVIRAWGLNFNLGSAVKYISRAGHKDDIVQDLRKAQEFIQFEIDAIEGARRKEPPVHPNCKCAMKDKPKHEDFMDAMLRGLFGGSVGHIEITGKRNGRNVPNNLTEIVDTVTKLDGKVDKETLLSLLPFIDNPKEVLEKLDADKERDRQNTDPYSTQNITEDSNYLFPNLNAQNSRQEALNAQGATIPQPEQ